MSIQSSLAGKGTMLALGAAALILSGCAATGTNTSASGAAVHCAGVNSCKGTSDCKTAGNACKGTNSCKTATNSCKGTNSCKSEANACKGQNACKGHGFLEMSADECVAKHGKIV